MPERAARARGGGPGTTPSHTRNGGTLGGQGGFGEEVPGKERENIYAGGTTGRPPRRAPSYRGRELPGDGGG